MYLATYLFEIGPTLPDGVGEAPISHTELMAWQGNTGVELQAWEARTLHRVSREYLSEKQAAVKHDAPPPWIAAPYVKPIANHAAIRMQRTMMELAKL